MSRSPGQLSNVDPFLILYNYRGRKESHDSSHVRRVPHDYSSDRKSIILTRKMKAQLQERARPSRAEAGEQGRQEESEGREEEGRSESGGEESSEFFNKTELQKGIPLSDWQDEDILYNRNEMSWASNYSKLEKTLFGTGFASGGKGSDGQEQVDQPEF